MSKKSKTEQSPPQPAKPETSELSETQLDQVPGGLIVPDGGYAYIPRRRP